MDEDFELTVGGKTYRSLDELSPELREKLRPYLEKARAAKAAAGAAKGKIRINVSASFKIGSSAEPQPGAVLGTSGDAGRGWLFWLMLLAGAALLLLRLKGR